MRNVNPDLPILDELGREFELMATGAPAPSSSAPPSRPEPARVRRRGHGSRRTARIGRRAAVVLVLLCLVGGVALAARFASGGGRTPAHTAPALLGRTAGAWGLSAYRDQGRLCFLLTGGGGALTSECGSAPGADGVRATSLRAGGRRLVAGIAGPKVGEVRVRVGSIAVRTSTHAAADRGAAAAAGVPSGSRWFVASLPGAHAAADAPALLTPLDGNGKRLGAPYLDCSLGVAGAACERRIRAAATAAEHGA